MKARQSWQRQRSCVAIRHATTLTPDEPTDARSRLEAPPALGTVPETSATTELNTIRNQEKMISKGGLVCMIWRVLPVGDDRIKTGTIAIWVFAGRLRRRHEELMHSRELLVHQKLLYLYKMGRFPPPDSNGQRQKPTVG